MLEIVPVVDEVPVMAAKDTDSEAFDALEHQFRHMRPALVAWVRRRVGDPVEAEDLVQECFLRVTHRGEADDLSHLEGYLYRTAKSVLADRRRRRAVRHSDTHVPLQPEHEEADETDALRILLAKEELQRVSAVLMAMPERTRSIFLLCRLEGMRYAEIAPRFGISVSAVQKHMRRAIETLLLAREEPA